MKEAETIKLIEHYGSIFAMLSGSSAMASGRSSKEDLIQYVARLRELVMSLPDEVKPRTYTTGAYAANSLTGL